MIIPWKFDEQTGDIIRLPGSGQDRDATGEIRALGFIPPHSTDRMLITAHRDGSHELRVTSWVVNENGNITRRDSKNAGLVTSIDIERAGPDKFVTAVRDSSSKLLLILWHVDLTTGRIDRLADAHHLQTSQSSTSTRIISIPDTLPNSVRYVTAIQDNNENNLLELWRINEQDNNIIRLPGTLLTGFSTTPFELSVGGPHSGGPIFLEAVLNGVEDRN